MKRLAEIGTLVLAAILLLFAVPLILLGRPDFGSDGDGVKRKKDEAKY